MKFSTIIYFIITLYVGGFMLYGGYQKFAKPLPSPTKMIETFEKEGAEKMKKDKKLIIKNYIFGMKQTGFFWQFLGICEILFGILIISQYLRFVGAVMLLPITLQIFLFHIFLELDDTQELIQTGLLFIGNLALITKELPKWKHLIITKI
ncbi:MAG: DoxX family membrane protein [Cytophagia bacterium]|nr:MAG: DoxX family membrane protein [Cytophagia bacterium]TAG40874.1 MAG: DoxX family membrane protein [Cytophagia bacterium]